MGLLKDRETLFYRLLYLAELVVGEIAFVVTIITVLPLVRFYTEYLGVWYERMWWTWSFPLSIDGFHPRGDVDVTFNVAYGDGTQYARACVWRALSHSTHPPNPPRKRCQ